MNVYRYFVEIIIDALKAMQESGELPMSLEFGGVTAEPPKDAARGDISTNAALVLAKLAGCPPREIAAKLLEQLTSNSAVESGEIAGPGFVNLKLNAKIWQQCLRDSLDSGLAYGDSDLGRLKKVNVEYVSANPTGPLHVAHARGAVFGDALANLLTKAGYRVSKEYYINDAGAQVDSLGRAVYLRMLEELGMRLNFFPNLLYPGDYVRDIARALLRKSGTHGFVYASLVPAGVGPFVEQADKDDSNSRVPSNRDGTHTSVFNAQESFPHSALRGVRAMFESHGSNMPQVQYAVGYNESYWLSDFRMFAVQRMMKNIRKDLRDLGVKMNTFSSERALVEKGAVDRVFRELSRQDLVYQGRLDPPKGQVSDDWEDREQTLFRATRFGDEVDRPLKKSDGSWTYFANDIAYHHDKYRRGFAEMIDVWGADHGGYVKRMKAAVSAVTEGQAKLDVKLCQLVRVMRNGELVRMSKRAGTFETLRDLLDEVGPDVVRFTMLTRKNDTQFDFDLVKATEQSRDNPVWYVQYGHARTRSVMRQAAAAGIAIDGLASAPLDRLSDAGELALIRMIAQWPRQIEAAALTHEPHRIAAHLYDLAAAFHSHWSRGREEPGLRFVIEGDSDLTRARLALVQGIGFVIGSGLKVFGVTPVDEMR